jgi:hypothetical protein
VNFHSIGTDNWSLFAPCEVNPSSVQDRSCSWLFWFSQNSCEESNFVNFPALCYYDFLFFHDFLLLLTESKFRVNSFMSHLRSSRFLAFCWQLVQEYLISLPLCFKVVLSSACFFCYCLWRGMTIVHISELNGHTKYFCIIKSLLFVTLYILPQSLLS